MPHRKQMHRYERKGEARFLTFSCYQRLPFFNNDKIKQPFVDELKAARDALDFKLWAWVLMPEHVHLILLPNLPEAPVSRVLHRIKRIVASKVIARWREMKASILDDIRGEDGVCRFWQPGGGYDRNLYTTDELWEKIDYIHGNPIERGLVLRATEWIWSSARFFAGLEESKLEIDPIE
ncbi:MAG: transposase [Phycisphaeraceae bacterium]